MSRLEQQVGQILDGGAPLVYLYSPEEGRMLRVIRQQAQARNLPVHQWSCIRGMDAQGDESRAPVVALTAVLADTTPGIYVFSDLDAYFGEPEVLRALREVSGAHEEVPNRWIFVISPQLRMPDNLKQEFCMLEVSVPDEGEIALLLEELRQQNLALPITDSREITLALKGLTEEEITYVVRRIAQMPDVTHEQMMDEIFAEKQAMVKKTGFLEFSPPKWKLGGVGGLDNLKDWLVKRAHTFSQEALEAGVPVPKGLLIMGVSGCGKSLAVKTISSLWNIPVFRLDMNLVFSGMYGSPEEAFHNAMKTIEAVAPAVLWIDEIENALGMDDSGHRIASHIFSSFLTWMQEKPSLIFIAATANKIQALPAEILRKGRFDEVFFCDLPAAQERMEILKIHLSKNGANPDDFDLKMLQVETEGWNGAEIEQAVVSAKTEAYFENRPFTQRDLSSVIGRIVPLSETMEQQIKFIRSWAFSRATPASKYSKASAKPH